MTGGGGVCSLTLPGSDVCGSDAPPQWRGECTKLKFKRCVYHGKTVQVLQCFKYLFCFFASYYTQNARNACMHKANWFVVLFLNCPFARPLRSLDWEPLHSLDLAAPVVHKSACVHHLSRAIPPAWKSCVCMTSAQSRVSYGYQPSVFLSLGFCVSHLIPPDWERLGFSIAFTDVATNMGISETEKGSVFAAFYYGYSVTPVCTCYLSFVLLYAMLCAWSVQSFNRGVFKIW